MNPEQQLVELRVNFERRFKARANSKPRAIERIANSPSRRVKVKAQQLERESLTHHATEKKLLEAIDEFARACKNAHLEVKFTPAMWKVLNDHGVRKTIREEALHETLRKDREIRAALKGHNRRMQSLFIATAKIKAKHGFGSQN